MGAVIKKGQTAEERLQKLLGIQTLLAKVAREIGAALELEPVLKTVLSAMRSMVEFRGGTIQLVDERGCYIAAADPPVTAELASSRVPVGTGLSGTAVATAATIYSPDLDHDPRVDPVQRRTGNNAATHSYLAVPLVVLGECIGVLQMDSNDIDAFDGDDRAVLEGLATQVAGAIESARRYEHVVALERLKDEFIERISHELRTPLTIVMGFTDMLLVQDKQMSRQQHEEALLRIRSAVNRLSGLLEEILYLSSLDAGSIQVHLEMSSIADLAERVREISRDPGRVELEVDPGLRFPVDGLLVRHMVTRVVDNALKYAGDAVVRAEVDPETDELVISVRDHGPGVGPEHRALMFDRFWRGQHWTAGMGLGLATVRRLASSMGARVSVVDPPGGGMELTVRFPRAGIPAAAEHKRRAPDGQLKG